MRTRRVLICGAGIAGATLAHWLARSDFDVTLVEVADGTRSSGAPVDVRSDALSIVDRMGVLDDLRAAATIVRETVIVNDHGDPIARLATQNAVGRNSPVAEVEVARPDLARILLSTLAAGTEVIHGDSINELSQDSAAVDVVFRSGRKDRFDLVIGADGVHSMTRSLVFGAEAGIARHCGLYVATLPVPGLTDPPDVVQHYNAPGRSVTIHPAAGVPTIAFMIRSPALPWFDPRDLDQHRRLILERFGHDRWRTPELLDHVRAAPDVYADAVSRLALRSWSLGRIGLVGDAASAVSLLGDGSTKAIIGAYTLARELAATEDHVAAFRRYQQRHSRRISPAWQVRAAAAFLVPRTAIGIGLRNRLLRTAALKDRGLQTVSPT